MTNLAHGSEDDADVRGRWRTALAALRLSQWRHFLLLPAAGQGIALVQTPRQAGPALALGALLAAGCLAWAYGLNALKDRHDDRSERKNPLVANPTSWELNWLLGASLLATAMLAARLGGWSATAATVSLLAGTVYSAGPRLKALPAVGTLTNALIFAPLPLLGVLPGAAPSAALALLTAVFIALLCHNQLLHELADAAEDGAAGIRTTAALLGPTASTALGALLAGLALMCAADRQPVMLLGCAAVVLSFSVLQLARSHTRAAASLRSQHRHLCLLGGAALWALALAGEGL